MSEKIPVKSTTETASNSTVALFTPKNVREYRNPTLYGEYSDSEATVRFTTVMVVASIEPNFPLIHYKNGAIQTYSNFNLYFNTAKRNCQYCFW